MNIKEELAKVDPDLLEKAFEFVAHALNDTKVVHGACEEAGITKAEGYAFAQFFVELGISGIASVTTMADFEMATGDIKASMPELA